ncbi:hypothetical protein [Mycolicibacterium fluoranthenivorans]|uniref:Uncharacterized protein n=1 Tax=Mycolicibacterium fluoranthenivorans TaxID=258505 RepID=A0A7X5U6A7_9MYCO|nr:hypothetical protein [Mycolicibacterium fluoranthenivorans]MCV7356491.1 hypothetical protein [Mycolicibacterium fluoranthenivorans]NIH99122.1 hypothetical protein [Mycolicibacterium fluoranthenivorans]
MDDVWGDEDDHEDDDDQADWRDDPTLTDTARQALEALERAGQGPPPPDHDPVFQEFCSGAIARKLAMVRDERERILAEYDATVFKARQAGMSWGEIGRRLGVSRQQLHRSYAGRCAPEEPL